MAKIVKKLVKYKYRIMYTLLAIVGLVYLLDPDLGNPSAVSELSISTCVYYFYIFGGTIGLIARMTNHIRYEYFALCMLLLAIFANILTILYFKGTGGLFTCVLYFFVSISFLERLEVITLLTNMENVQEERAEGLND